jgi:hypothetical protein
MTVIRQAHHLHQPVYILYIDLAKAYDTVDRGLLWRVMLVEQDIEPALVG